MGSKPPLGKYPKLLERYGFDQTYASGLRSSFDIISKKRDKVMILKFVDNIDSLSRDEALALKKLNDFFDANVFVVFRTYKGKKAEKETMFTRHGVDCLSHATFELALNGGNIVRAQRFIKAKYKIDSNELKRLRKLQNISMSGLSTRLKISKDTIYRYEKGNGFATKPTLRKLEGFFKTTLTETQTKVVTQGKNYTYHKISSTLDVNFLNVGSSPFHVLGKKHSRYEIAYESDRRTMKKLADFYKKLSDVLDDDYPFFIKNEKNKLENLDGIPLLSNKELREIKDEKELLDIIQSRKKN
jgi:predicted transcriptional regulator